MKEKRQQEFEREQREQEVKSKVIKYALIIKKGIKETKMAQKKQIEEFEQERNAKRIAEEQFRLKFRNKVII